MTIKVCGPRVLIKQHKLEEVNPTFKRAREAGLALPEASREIKLEQRALDRGVVLQIGPLAWLDWDNGDPWCNVGDEVLYARHAGKIVKEKEGEDEEEFVLLNDEDIIAVITEEE
jgi:co-chaperonin GroES (HSP10)